MEIERKSVCARVWLREFVYVCVIERDRERESVCVCVVEREGVREREGTENEAIENEFQISD
jgi:hypothetical protein